MIANALSAHSRAASCAAPMDNSLPTIPVILMSSSSYGSWPLTYMTPPWRTLRIYFDVVSLGAGRTIDDSFREVSDDVIGCSSPGRVDEGVELNEPSPQLCQRFLPIATRRSRG